MSLLNAREIIENLLKLVPEKFKGDPAYHSAMDYLHHSKEKAYTYGKGTVPLKRVTDDGFPNPPDLIFWVSMIHYLENPPLQTQPTTSLS